MDQSIKELIQFLQIGARLDLKYAALDHILGITGSDSGITALTKYPGLLVSLIALLDDKSENVALNSSKCLINISADREASDKLLDLNMKEYCPPLQRPCQNIVSTTLNFVLQPGNKLAQNCLMILLNLSYHKFEKIIDLMETSDFSLDDVIDALVKKQVNNTDLDYLGPVLSNLSQSGRVRKHILNKNKGVVQRLLPFVNYPGKVLRKGLVGILKNCCFEQDAHDWLLGDDVDILPQLLLPLAGGEEFDDEDNDKLPLDLQYLPEDKQREKDAEIRRTLLETLIQLCAKRSSREFIRERNAYLILRELHKVEDDLIALTLCEDLVNILIRTEEEIGKDNLKDVIVPEDLLEKFQLEDHSEKV